MSIQWNEQSQLDKDTRARMKQVNNEPEYRVKGLFFISIIFAFLTGMVLGSALHDDLFHATEPAFKEFEKGLR